MDRAVGAEARAPARTSPTERIEELRALALSSGAGAAMLMGAGGGGFLLVYAPDPAAVRAAMAEAGRAGARRSTSTSRGCEAERGE